MNLKGAELSSIYLHELFRLTATICEDCEFVFREARLPDEGEYLISPGLAVHTRIASILVAAANVKRLLYPQSDKRRVGSSAVIKLRQQRARALLELVAGIELNEMLNVKVRNSVEHFDEYLDRVNVELFLNTADTPDIAAYNMTFSSWNAIKPRPYPVRLYIADERKFYNFDYSIDIGKIYTEAQTMLSQLREAEPVKSVDRLGGMFIKLACR